MISIIIPTLNAAAHLPRALPPLVPAVAEGLVRELIVSDGGSTDATLAMADAAGARIVEGPEGRGRQLIAGAALARGDWLLFLHAETMLDEGWSREAARFMSTSASRAATFQFAQEGGTLATRWLAWWVGIRTKVMAQPHGDQGLLIARALYDEVGGYRDMAGEDVDIVRRIGRARLAPLHARAVIARA